MKLRIYRPLASTNPSVDSANTETQPGFFKHLNLKKLSSIGISLLSVVLSLTTFSNAALAQYLQRNLQLGTQGSDVETLQSRLQGLGYFNGPLTGYYGSITEEAVTRFQRLNGLDPDGIYGPDTDRVLRSLRGEGSDMLSDGIGFPNPTIGSARYVVVVPIRGSNTYSKVISVVGRGNAVVRDSGLGDYVQAGAFSTYNGAAGRVRQLRQAGLSNARVDFR